MSDALHAEQESAWSEWQEAGPELGSVVTWAPQPGPQEMFAKCDADIAIFGGSAGGGKSFALLYESVKWTAVEGVDGYTAVLFRRTTPELLGGGGLWDEAKPIFKAFGGHPRGAPTLDWTFESKGGARDHRILFRHLQFEDDVKSYQGQQYAFIGLDELTHFTESQFLFLVGRLRSMSGVSAYLRGTCNPDPDSFVAELVSWWIGDDGFAIPERSGIVRWFVRVERATADEHGSVDDLAWYDSKEEALAEHPDGAPMSFTFIASRLKDNKKLTDADPTYRAKLKMLKKDERDRMLGDEERGGNWNQRAARGTFFKGTNFQLRDDPPSPIVRTIRFWDKAASLPTKETPNPDWTRGVRVSLCESGDFWIEDGIGAQLGPVAVLDLMLATAQKDGHSVAQGLWRDTGQAGLVDIETTRGILADFEVEIVDSWGMPKANDNAKTKSSAAKKANARAWAKLQEDGRVFLKRVHGHTTGLHGWNKSFVAEHEAFPNGRFDDWVDAMSGAMRVLTRDRGTSLLEAMQNVRFGNV
jgi:phage terminase large subunit-like protein